MVKPAARRKLHAVCAHPVGRRYAAIALRDVAGLSLAEVARHVPGANNASLRRWRGWLGDPQRAGCEGSSRKPRAGRLGPADLAIAKQVLRTGGRGQRKHQSLKKGHSQFAGAGARPASREAYRIALIKSGHVP